MSQTRLPKSQNRRRKHEEISSTCSQSVELECFKKQKLNSFSPIKHGFQKITYSFLNIESYEAKECGGAGNCLFKSISYQLPQEPDNTHEMLRKRACIYIKNNMIDFKQFLDGLINEQTQKPYTSAQYVKQKSKDGEYGDEPEIFALSNILGITIRVYTEFKTDDSLLGYLLRSEYQQKYSSDIILLHFIPNDYAPHYQALKLRNSILKQMINNPSQKKELKNESENFKKDNLDPTESHMEKPKEQSHHDLGKVKRRDINQKYGPIKNFGNKYNEILLFFQKNTIPERFKNLKRKCAWKSKVLKKYKYDELLDRIMELKKVSYPNLPNISNKSKFDSSLVKYEFFYYIPFENEKPQLLELAHTKLLHQGRDRMITSIHTTGYSWYGITQDCEDYISSCPSCPIPIMQKIPSITTKQIIEEHPRARYQIDTVLLAEGIKTENVKYLITIEDHFSKFLWAKTSKTKDAKSIQNALKTFFVLCGQPIFFNALTERNSLTL